MASGVSKWLGRYRCRPYYWPVAGGPQRQQGCPAATRCFPLPPQSCPKPQPDPASRANQHFGRFAETKITAPAPQIRASAVVWSVLPGFSRRM